MYPLYLRVCKSKRGEARATSSNQINSHVILPLNNTKQHNTQVKARAIMLFLAALWACALEREAAAAAASKGKGGISRSILLMYRCMSYFLCLGWPRLVSQGTTNNVSLPCSNPPTHHSSPAPHTPQWAGQNRAAGRHPVIARLRQFLPVPRCPPPQRRPPVDGVLLLLEVRGPSGGGCEAGLRGSGSGDRRRRLYAARA